MMPFAIGVVLFIRGPVLLSHQYNPRVFESKTAFMQRCADYVRAGYVMHVSGTIPITRIGAVLRKFRDLYLVHASKDMRYRRKRAGLGNAVALLWRPGAYLPPQPGEEARLVYVLLVTPENHPALQLERLEDARDSAQRLRITGYELVRQTRRAASAPSWTYRMTPETCTGWRDRVRAVVRSRDSAGLTAAWTSLHRSPGYAPIRRQVFQIRHFFRAEYKRNTGKPLPFLAPRIRYVDRLPNGRQPVSSVIQIYTAGAGELDRPVPTPFGRHPDTNRTEEPT
jgi:hypothetical protein